MDGITVGAIAASAATITMVAVKTIDKFGKRNNCKPVLPGQSPLCIEHAKKVASHERAITNIDATLLRIESQLQSMNKHLLTLKR